jgi:beta-phosphoglucomutase-like phosphatase (HAD superfamily)
MEKAAEGGMFEVEAGKLAGMITVMVPDLHASDETDRNGLYALAQSLYDVIPLLD